MAPVGTFIARALVLVMLLGGCASGLPELPSARRTTEPRPQGGDVVVGGVTEGSVIVGLPDGGLLVGMKSTGTVLEADGLGHIESEPVARLEVSTQGDRGLLGLAVDNEERVFASYTDPDGRLRVSQIAPGDPIDIWVGPVTTGRGIGGALTIDQEGRLVLGVGAMNALDRAEDTSAPNAKVLRLDPALGPDQEPGILSRGWHEPRALVIAAEGELWVLDRRRDEPSVIARADPGDEPGAATPLPDLERPVGMTAVGTERLFVCDAISGRLMPYVLGHEQASLDGGPIVPDCAGAVVQLADGRIAYVSDGSVKTLLA